MPPAASVLQSLIMKLEHFFTYATFTVLTQVVIFKKLRYSPNLSFKYEEGQSGALYANGYQEFEVIIIVIISVKINWNNKILPLIMSCSVFQFETYSNVSNVNHKNGIIN